MGKIAPVSAFSMYQQQLKKGKSASKLKKSLKSKNKLEVIKNKKSHVNVNPTNIGLYTNSQNESLTNNQLTDKFELENDFFIRKPISQVNSSTSKKKIAPELVRLETNVKKEKKVKPKLKLSKKSSKSKEIVGLTEPTYKYEFFDRPYKLLSWILAPISVDDFFIKYWEKKPLYIKRSNKLYYDNILSTKELDRIFRNNSLFFTRNIDVVSYINGQRETHNPEGRAVPAVLWDYYENGCSIRVLNPQTYCRKLHTILATLQEYFGCMVGVNAYLTPPNSQGFAPHYDDIEAFVLQLEGHKNWKLYAPISPEEVLPRFSSKNLNRDEIGDPIKEITLEAGDVLYFPRGVIHEGSTDEDSHSLHVTISVYQKTAYVDLLEHIFKPALAQATQSDPEFREGLPLHYLEYLGFANKDNFNPIRYAIIQKVKMLFNKLTDYISVDDAADQLGKQFMWDAMPPIPSKEEKYCMIHKDGEIMKNGRVHNKVEINLNVKVRLFRYHCLRVVPDEENTENIRVYYSADNAKYYHGEEQQFLVMDEKFLSAIKYLIESYPHYVEVNSLPAADDIDKMQIVADLWERRLLVTEKPLQYYAT